MIHDLEPLRYRVKATLNRIKKRKNLTNSNEDKKSIFSNDKGNQNNAKKGWSKLREII